MKFQQRQALTSHFESFWSIVPLKKQAQKEHKSILRSQLEPLQLSYIPILQECRIERSFSLYNDGAEPSLCARYAA